MVQEALHLIGSKAILQIESNDMIHFSVSQRTSLHYNSISTQLKWPFRLIIHVAVNSPLQSAHAFVLQAQLCSYTRLKRKKITLICSI